MCTNQTTITEANYRSIPSVYIRLIYLFLMLLAWFSAGIGLICGDLILTGLASSAIITIVIHHSWVYKH